MSGDRYSIAIDGTAASGKSTVARLLAENLECSYLDTGKLYRAVALHFLSHLSEPPDEWKEGLEPLGDSLKRIDLRIETPKSGECRIILSGEDVNERLAELKTERATPFAARIPAVRDYLLDVQRQLAKTDSVVMAGRDIGTVVLPDATLKIFIDAQVKERARRRLTQHQDDYTERELHEAAEALATRDRKDSQREIAPMRAAEDALELDSTNQTPDELVTFIVSELKKRI